MEFLHETTANSLINTIMNDRKLILYISMSLDGFLATIDDDLSWLSIVEKEGED